MRTRSTEIGKPTETDPIDIVIDRLLNTASSAPAEDIVKYAAALKSLTEARNAKQSTILELFKAGAAFLVPVIAMLTMLATFFIQFRGNQLTSYQLEDTQWRELLASLKGQTQPDATVAARLASFFNSDRYGEQAQEIAISYMGGLYHRAAFGDLFDFIFGDEITPEKWVRVVDIGRAVLISRINVLSECGALSIDLVIPYHIDGFCQLGASTSELVTALGKPPPQRLLELRHAATNIDSHVVFIGTVVQDYLRSRFGPISAPKFRIAERKPRAVTQTKSVPREYHLTGLLLWGIDLSNVNLSKFDISHSEFVGVNFSGANLSVKKAAAVDFTSSNWWEAKFISGPLLAYLLTEYCPGCQPGGPGVPGGLPTYQHYRARINALCQPRQKVCDDSLKYLPFIKVTPLPKEED